MIRGITFFLVCNKFGIKIEQGTRIEKKRIRNSEGSKKIHNVPYFWLKLTWAIISLNHLGACPHEPRLRENIIGT